jgi:hypothetical protein
MVVRTLENYCCYYHLDQFTMFLIILKVIILRFYFQTISVFSFLENYTFFILTLSRKKLFFSKKTGKVLISILFINTSINLR